MYFKWEKMKITFEKYSPGRLKPISTPHNEYFEKGLSSLILFDKFNKTNGHFPYKGWVRNYDKINQTFALAF